MENPAHFCAETNTQGLGGDQARRVQFRPKSGAARQLQIAGPAPMVETVRRHAPPVNIITLF